MDEVAKYFVASPEATKGLVDLIERYPDRFCLALMQPRLRISPSIEGFLSIRAFVESTRGGNLRKVRLRNYERSSMKHAARFEMGERSRARRSSN